MGELILVGTIVGGVGLAVLAARVTLHVLVNAMPRSHKAKIQA